MKKAVLIQLAGFAAVRQVVAQLFGPIGSMANEYYENPCRNITMLFARGWAEPTNMGIICGPPTANQLKAKFGNAAVAVQGVLYTPTIEDNNSVNGASPKAAADLQSLIHAVLNQCPHTLLVVGGYSSGASLVHLALKTLPEKDSNQIVAAFTYGDAQYKQDGGRIPNFPESKTKIICETNDKLCQGSKDISQDHLNYGYRANEMVDWLSAKLKQGRA